jgi:hypothetical protein
MKLITKALAKQLPPLYSQEEKGDAATVVAKFFTPDSQWTWYATEASAVLSDGREVSLAEAAELCGLRSAPATARDGQQELAARAVYVEDVTFFGLVDGFCEELGYFTLDDLEQARGPFGPKIERDLWWTPVPLAQVRRVARGATA